MTREKAQREIDDSDRLFKTLMNEVQEMQTKLRLNIERKLRKSQEKDETRIRELQEEIAELQRTHSELNDLSQNDDHLQLLQTLQALSTISDTKDWSQIRVYSDLCMQSVRRAMSHLVHTFQTELKTLTNTELTRMKQYKESVTFDQATAGSYLVVTESGKRLKYSKYASPSSSDDLDLDRFDCPMVLGTKGFTSGRHYWEVQVRLKRIRIKLQQAIQERVSKVEKIKLSVDRSGENPKEAWAQNKELVKQLEEEISELQRKNAELEQLSQTEDNLHFLQVCSMVKSQNISNQSD
ncbi:E3 ubiquitin-protein ligase TRIM39-like protein [Lates japonicus]|uniref:E3 ubiquitin-protein ligase TRIM39-like protein n=1 Tax=Lates japonicus TaxID=270547 RepID=A0AAD3N2Q1_LATJO|nr:E3 ubiquitin-protein ligase TRIM39-like protein [Lates japonicus]